MPVSAVAGEQVDLLTDLLIARLPVGPAAVPGRRDHRRAAGDADRRVGPRGRPGRRPRGIAAFAGRPRHRDRPAGIGRGSVVVGRVGNRPGSSSRSLSRGRSQKAIVLGHKGSRLADVGRRARLQIQPLLGTGCIWICTSRSRRTGNATRSSCGSWASTAEADNGEYSSEAKFEKRTHQVWQSGKIWPPSLAVCVIMRVWGDMPGGLRVLGCGWRLSCSER